MRKIVSILLLLFLSYPLFSQLVIHQVDSSKFPEVTLFVSGEKLELEEIEIMEAGSTAEIISIKTEAQEKKKPVDIVFVVDNSGTMYDKVQIVIERLGDLVRLLHENGYDARFAVLGFGTEVNKEFVVTGGSRFTSSPEKTIERLKETIQYPGGKDECQIHALWIASNYDFRKDASKILILLTDEDTTQNKLNEVAKPKLVENIIKRNLTVFTLRYDPDPVYEELAKLSGGQVLSFKSEFFEEALKRLFTFAEYYSTVTYISPLSYPLVTFSEPNQLILKNMLTGSQVSVNYMIPERSDVKLSILEINKNSFPDIDVKVIIESTDKYILENINVFEDGIPVGTTEPRLVSEKLVNFVDVVFVLDTTGSMTQELNGMVENLIEFSNILENYGVLARVGLVTFGDEIRLTADLTPSFEKIRRLLQSQTADGGGDVPEISLDALNEALNMNFLDNSQKILILITDASPHIEGDGTKFSSTTIEETRKKILASGATLILVVPSNKEEFVRLSEDIPGQLLDIHSAKSFGELIKFVAKQITRQYDIHYTTSNLEPNTEREVIVSYGLTWDSKVYLSPELITSSQTTPTAVVSDFEINSFTAKPFVVEPGGIVTLRCLTYPEDGLVFNWSAESGIFVEFGNNTAKWVAPDVPGYYSVFVIVSDGSVKKVAEVVVLVSDKSPYD